MRTAEGAPSAAGEGAEVRPAAAADGPRLPGARAAVWTALALILLGGLGLRLWGIRHGLPFVYNTDEAQHFVPHAVQMFAQGTLDPRYLANPPAFTYLVHFLASLWYGGGRAVVREYALHPGAVYTLARVTAAVLGTAALWLLYATGSRLFGRAAGLLAAAVEAVAFLPVFYGHLALNDVPTLAPLTLSLLGSVRVLQAGRIRDHVLAGAGLGLACATKYTGGIAVLPLLAAIVLRVGGGGPAARRGALLGLLAAGAAALALFVLANPYALIHGAQFRHELAHQSAQSAEAQGKLGAPRHGGIAYYLWTLTWGLVWAPALAALGGAVLIWQRRPRAGALLVPAPLLFLLFMGAQGRYFGRWLLPAFPFLCLLAAWFALELAGLVGRLAPGPPTRGPDRRAASGQRRGRPQGGPRIKAGRAYLTLAAASLLGAGLLVQGLIHSVHGGLVLSRADTRTIVRRWLIAHVPRGSRIVAEPVSPDEWAHEARPGTSTRGNPPLWRKYPSLVSRISATGALTARETQVTIEDYVRTLAPALLGYYTAHGYCFVVSGSTQSGRAFADAGAVPLAIAYYRELARTGTVVFRASPYARGAGPTPFGFDWSFDYYPLGYERPGPQVIVYRLHGGRCR